MNMINVIRQLVKPMLVLLVVTEAQADPAHVGHANTHAPIGVMGDHLHAKGEWMLSYRFMRMDMHGNQQGRERITPEQIVTQIPNRFAANPMMPPTLRVVPLEMTTDMHMFGVMRGLSDNVTLMLMLNLVEKDMEHVTFAGGMGTTVLGRFRTRISGLGDTRVSALVQVYRDPVHAVHLNLGLSLPTGDNDETGAVLTPMGMMPRARLPYAMQLGTGTYNAEPGVTYSGISHHFNWGAQLLYSTPIDGFNDEGYRPGDRFALTAWLGYAFTPALNVTVRTSYRDLDRIDGLDPLIMAAVQTADPGNYGGQTTDIAFGANYLVQSGTLKGHRFALEYQTVLNQDVNGVQLEMADMLTLGYQLAF